MTVPIILIGGGGHSTACMDVIEAEGKYHIAGIVDKKEKIGTSVLGYGIIAADNRIEELAGKYDHFLVSVGQIKTAETRKRFFFLLENLHVNLPVVISPYAVVSRHAGIDKGTIIMHQALVNAGAVIGKNCILNSKALIEHGVKVGDHCHISTGALINGDVRIGEGCFIGSGAVIREGVHIGEKSVIGAGARIMKDIEAGSWVKP